jgi:hypothetical protein
MAHFNVVGPRGYYDGNACGYDPHRGLKSPSAVKLVDPTATDPRCSRCERRLAVAA